jgi:hypothetical protein
MLPDEPVALGYLTKATGYGLVVLPSANASQLATSLSGVPGVGKYMTGFSARTVTKGGSSVAIALVFSLDPSFAAVPGIYDAFVKGVAGTTHTPTPETLSGLPATYFADLGGIAGLVWVQKTVIVIEYGTNRTAMEQLGIALISGNQ